MGLFLQFPHIRTTESVCLVGIKEMLLTCKYFQLESLSTHLIYSLSMWPTVNMYWPLTANSIFFNSDLLDFYSRANVSVCRSMFPIQFGISSVQWINRTFYKSSTFSLKSKLLLALFTYFFTGGFPPHTHLLHNSKIVEVGEEFDELEFSVPLPEIRRLKQVCERTKLVAELKENVVV